MTVNLIQTINGIHTILLFCSNIIRRGWGSKEGVELRLEINKVINKVIALQQDTRLSQPSKDLAAALTNIRTKLDAGEYETGEKFLNKLKNTLVVGLENMARSLELSTVYEAEIDKLRRMKIA